MKVMTFNLRHIIKEDLLGLWRKRYKRIVSFIIKENPDIIGVQELTNKGRRYLKRYLKDYKVIGKKRHSIIFTNEYNCLLIKKDIKINGHKTYSLSDKITKLGRRDKADKFPRICTVAHLEKNNIKFFIANTHMDNSSTQNKKRLLDIFDSIVEKYKREDEYVIILGDFNMSLDNRYLVKYSLKYVDPFKNSTIGTYPSVPDMKAIDHIFLDKNILFTKEIIHSDSNDSGYMSDHYPMSCEIIV